MLRVTGRLRIYRPPDESVLTDDRRRFVKPIRAAGTDDDPDVFDVRERIPEEFTYDPSPQEAGKRAKKIEEALTQAFEQVERVDEGDS